jgi:hypothetical protein
LVAESIREFITFSGNGTNALLQIRQWLKIYNLKGPPDINAVRRLVESFVDPDTATSSRPEDGIRRHGADEKVP